MARNPKNTRMCAACRQRRDKSQLLGITKTGDGIAISSPGSHIEGRSAYLCPSVKCIDTAIKRKSLSRSLKCEIEPEIFELLQSAIKTE